MAKSRASVELPAQISAAEALWYDLRRWPSFVDGFGAVARSVELIRREVLGG